jgi:hypothetical protein
MEAVAAVATLLVIWVLVLWGSSYFNRNVI